MNNITTSNFIALIESIVEDDIQALENVISVLEEGERKTFLESLHGAKKEILNSLPLGFDVSSSGANAPNKQSPESYHGEEAVLEDANKLITKVCLNIEMSQSTFLKNQIKLDGIPDEVKEDLEPVLEIYEKIVHHLDRADSTQQLGAINYN